MARCERHGSNCGGGDWGMKIAADQGLIEAPRLFIAGQSISQTGGHGDFRRKTESEIPCGCSKLFNRLGNATRQHPSGKQRKSGNQDCRQQ